MNDFAVSIDNLTKSYTIGRVVARTTEDEANLSAFKRFRRAMRKLRGQRQNETLWALRGVSFDVKPGEVVGLIGSNGAGKSTLLKILSRITEPSSGRAVISGRVGSLLEVGTGFHPELTGRENIYLSGAILGMRQDEISKKFDEIVAFAEVERFLETPVKRYSSGMYVRLAFAVAAHLEPEVLLVDEVLAVGDAAFQKKCLGKMGDVAQQGRTVLFVSHNMVAVQTLCHRGIWLKEGAVQMDGPAKDVAGKYLSTSFSSQTERTWQDTADAPGNDKVRIRRVCLRPEQGKSSDPITMSTPLVIEVDYWSLQDDQYLQVALQFFTDQQIVAFSTTAHETDTARVEKLSRSGLFRSTVKVPADLLNSGSYRVMLLVHRNGARIAYRDDNALCFEVLEIAQRQGTWYGREPGTVRPLLEWRTEYCEPIRRVATAV